MDSVAYDVLHSDEEEPEVSSTQPESDRNRIQVNNKIFKPRDQIKREKEFDDENEVSSASIEETNLNETESMDATLPETQSDKCISISCGQRIIEHRNEPEHLLTGDTTIQTNSQANEKNSSEIDVSVKKRDAQSALIKLKNMYLDGKLTDGDMEMFRNIMSDLLGNDVQAAKGTTESTAAETDGLNVGAVCATHGQTGSNVSATISKVTKSDIQEESMGCDKQTTGEHEMKRNASVND